MRAVFAFALAALVLPAAAAPARKAAPRAARPPVHAQSLARPQPGTHVYIGSFTNTAGLPPSAFSDRGEGIYVATFDARGGLSMPRLAAKTPSPVTLLFDPAHGVLYAANAYRGFLDPKIDHGVGTISAWRIDPATGDLSLIGQASAGGVPTALAFDPSGHYLLCADPEDGVLAALPIKPDGSPGGYSDLVRPGRSQVNDLVFDPGGHYALAADTGARAILEFAFDAKEGKFSQIAAFPQTAAPRRLAFNARGDVLYALSEDAGLSVSSFDPAKGALKLRQTLSAVPPHYAGMSLGAGLLLSKAGNHLYAASGSADTIMSFSVGHDGSLKPLGEIAAGGAVTSAIALDLDGRYLFALARQAGSVAVFALDGRGLPKPSPFSAAVPSPAAVVFAVR